MPKVQVQDLTLYACHRNLSEPLEDGRQTNQRAEIMAAIRALETCADTKSP
ncbi:5988_t:CDS:2, partial [Paraglomus occultum]